MDRSELQKLKALADTDDPAALYNYAENVRPLNAAEADKYILLAAYRGDPRAAEKFADKCRADGDYENADQFYRAGARGGIVDCSVKLAVMNLEFNESASVHSLETLAESGVRSAVVALAAYYKEKGNRRAYRFWNSVLKP